MRRLWSTVLLALPLATALAAQPVVDITLEQHKVTTPGEVVRVEKGDAVTLRWHSDEAVELHMHGYDIHLKLEPGKPAEMHFDASVSGRFPVSRHAAKGTHGRDHEALLYVEIYPE